MRARIMTVAWAVLPCFAAWANAGALDVTVPPPTQPGIRITYPVPPQAPDEIQVLCSWSAGESGAWHPARVSPLISETAHGLVTTDQWNAWHRDGRIIEHRAAGLSRTVVFNPYPEAVEGSRVDIRFRVTLSSSAGEALGSYETRINETLDAVYVEAWDQVLTQGEVAPAAEGTPGKWQWQSGLPESEAASFGTALYGESDPKVPLRPLSYALDLRGPHAIFVCTKPSLGIRMRLSGDERSDDVGSRLQGEEILWRVSRMDHQHLVIQQPHRHTGYTPAQIDYVKLVPLTEAQYAEWQAQYHQPQDKFVGAYFEPYSWAFNEDVITTAQHREPLLPYAEASMSLVDVQLGRFGMKSVYETRLTDQLLYSTIGDPIGMEVQPKTDNVGRMQQYTNTLDAELRYCRELGLKAHANFGASNCYVGTPLQGDFSKQHPEWVRGHALRLEVSEARAYAMSLYRESLELGAPGISIDFCRYPEAVDGAEAATQMLREMRSLADEFTTKRGDRVTVLVRFPGTGVRNAEHFDHAAWAREELPDYLCPSNIQGRPMDIDMVPYLGAVEGTRTMLLPCVDGLSWGLIWPGPLLWRVRQLYEQGAPGVYVYQADARLLGQPGDRRTMALLSSRAAVEDWWAREQAERPLRSKGIYITPPSELGVYHGWERIRIWTEGIQAGAVEEYIDDQRVSRQEGPPWLVGTEDEASDAVIPAGEHTLKIRAQDGDDWLEQTFNIKGG